MSPRFNSEGGNKKRRLDEIKTNLQEADGSIRYLTSQLFKAKESSEIRDLKRHLGKARSKWNRWSKKWMEEAQEPLPF